MYSRFLREVALAGLPSSPGSRDVITGSQLETLPEPAQRYARFMGVVGRAQDWSFRLSFTGRFRTRPQQRWMNCRTWQYNNRLAVARMFHICIRVGGLLPVIGRDTYVQGRGRMLIRFLDLFTIGDETGEEYDIGELVTYLNDAVVIAPTMLFVPKITWAAVDHNSFDVSLTNHGRTVSARVFVDERGAPTDFSTMDRFCYNPDAPKQLIRARWTTPIAGWDLIEGRRLPTAGQAVWHLPQGPFVYAEFRPVRESLIFNVPPSVETRHVSVVPKETA